MDNQNNIGIPQLSQVPIESVTPVSANFPLPPRHNNLKALWILIVAVIIIAGAYFLVSSKFKTPSMKPLTNRCSSFFGICLNDPDSKWKIQVDTLHDFDLVNASAGVSLFAMNSTSMSFKESGQAFTSATLLGQTSQVYKDTANGLTRVITGQNSGKGSLIIILASDKDISVENARNILGRVRTLADIVISSI